MLELWRCGTSSIVDIRRLKVKMDLQEVGCEDMDWIELAQGRDRWLDISGLAEKWLAFQEGLSLMDRIGN
jgi:hypothetical protein